MDRRAYAAVLALPGLALGVVGLFHPHSLSYATADRWFTLHLPGLLVFPLVGVALAAVVGRRTDPVAWVVRLAAYTYATCYTALDVVSGIAAGWVTRELGPGVPRPDEVRLLFRLGTPLGEVGSWALLATVVVLLADQLRRQGVRAAGGVLLLPGAWLVHTDHIFAPGGVAGTVLLGLGTAALVLARPPRHVPEQPAPALTG
ncbi:hypothetical protein [Nocardioides deserti]|uniref:Uncharacterized protein n=1 Tax=Nocardioides deserti TaxID=1588644 RepID=A0ABR6U8K2_9ACTN|nr:hypothetical protein [Nocardioides deserti]MBC2960710.1 hypothetical protein [Nocardioides deserti]GGO77148.1 hypothetical protein GCM10012276_31510 [Nocardioides deserti]